MRGVLVILFLASIRLLKEQYPINIIVLYSIILQAAEGLVGRDLDRGTTIKTCSTSCTLLCNQSIGFRPTPSDVDCVGTHQFVWFWAYPYRSSTAKYGPLFR